MAAIVNQALAGATVTYNGVQFGGGDSDFDSFPPRYQFRGQFIYDDSNRAVKGVEYTLNVSTIFFGSSPGSFESTVDQLREKLSATGKELKIEGLGTGFGTVSYDLDWGPRPISFDWQPLGNLAWEVVWSIRFFVVECASPNASPTMFAAFNFDTTWTNDFEGITQRTISGSAEIAPRRTGTGGKTPLAVAEELRAQIAIAVPVGFRRASNVWRESADKKRIEFVVVDEQFPGDYFPDGVTRVSGSTDFDSEGPGFAKARLSMSMTLRTAPALPRTLGGQIFLAAALGRIDAMNSTLMQHGGMAIPRRLVLRVGKFDDARETQGYMSWEVTKCLHHMLNASKLWEPVVPGNYTSWRASVEGLWGNRGLSGIRSNAQDGVIIDLCDQVTNVAIGDSSWQAPITQENPNFSFGCPEFPPDGGWMEYDFRIRIVRKDKQFWHKLATSYIPQQGQALDNNNTSGQNPIGGPAFTGGQEVVEHNGHPSTYIAIQFRALRIRNKPVMPELVSVAGLPVHMVEQEQEGPRLAFDLLACPVWFIRGYRIYRVDGYVSSITATGRKDSCVDPSVLENL